MSRTYRHGEQQNQRRRAKRLEPYRRVKVHLAPSL